MKIIKTHMKNQVNKYKPDYTIYAKPGNTTQEIRDKRLLYIEEKISNLFSSQNDLKIFLEEIKKEFNKKGLGRSNKKIIKKAALFAKNCNLKSNNIEYDKTNAITNNNNSYESKNPSINTISINTEHELTTKIRIGQNNFRSKLIEYWKGCSITKYSKLDILIASHFKPWNISNNIERLDLYNGLLLLPTLDKLFDKGYISFLDSGQIIISDLLDDFASLGISKDMKLFQIEDKHKSYLNYHRNNIFKTSNK